MVKLRVRKSGVSLGVILPKQAITRFGIQEGARLLLTEGPQGTYRVTTYNSSLAR
jgi:antitoxin component of MazEF toxin-antitoxin module